MTNVWDGFAVVEGVASAGSGAANAAYFARRAYVAHGARRGGAALLSLLFSGTAVASLHAAGEADAVAAVAVLPLLTANLLVSVLLWAGAGR